MIKFLSLLLAASIIGGSAFLGLSIYRKKNDQRLIPMELIMDQLERALADGSFPEKLSTPVSRYLDNQVASCEIVKSTMDGPVLKLLPLEGARFLFSNLIQLRDTGALCVAPDFGSPVLFLAPGSEGTISLHRQFGNSLLFSLVSGKLQISADKLHLEWKVPGMKLVLKSDAAVSLVLVRRDTDNMLNIAKGNLSVELLRANMPNETILPLLISTNLTSSLTSAGQPVASKGEQTTLLPSGFSPASLPPAPLPAAVSTP